jgi:hypothetical protein
MRIGLIVSGRAAHRAPVIRLSPSLAPWGEWCGAGVRSGARTARPAALES